MKGKKATLTKTCVAEKNYFFSSKLPRRVSYPPCLSTSLLHSYISLDITLANVKNYLPLFNPVDAVQFLSSRFRSVHLSMLLAPIPQTSSHQPLLALLIPSNSSFHGSSWVPLNRQCAHSSALSPLLFSFYF